MRLPNVLLRGLLTAACLFLWAVSLPIAEADVPDLDSVADSYRGQEDSLKSLYVKYRLSSRLLGTASDVQQYLQLRFLSDEVHVFAFKGNKRYYSFERTSSLADKNATKLDFNENKANSQPKGHDVPANAIYAFDGTVLRKRGVGGDTASILGISDLSHTESDASYFNPSYTGLVFRALPDVVNSNNDRALNRVSGAIASGRCRMRSGTEAVDGALCIVIEVGEDTVLWCDSSLGYAVRKQESYYSNTKLLQGRSTCSKFAEVCKGVWLPQKGVYEMAAPPSAPAEIHNSPIVAYDYDVSEINANDVPDELFSLQIPAGTLVFDFRNGQVDTRGVKVADGYYVPAGKEDLDRLVESLNRSPGITSRIAFWMSVALFFTLIAIVTRRRWKKQ